MFIVAEGVVTPTDRDGNPATDERGKTYTQKLRDGEHPKLMASRLIEELRLALRGHAPINGSGGPIVIQTSNEPDISPTPSTARREAAEEEVAKRRATDAQVLEDAERLIAAWNERQAKRMPMLFSLTIGAAITAGYWFLWVSCPACRTINAIDLRALDRHPDAAVSSLIPALSCRSCRPNAPFAEFVRLSRSRRNAG